MTFIWGQLFKLPKSLYSHLQDKKDELEMFNPGCTLKSYGDHDGEQKKSYEEPRNHPKTIKPELL